MFVFTFMCIYVYVFLCMCKCVHVVIYVCVYVCYVCSPLCACRFSDDDNSGRLSQEEFIRAISMIGGQEAARALTKKQLRRLFGREGKKTLGYDEFRAVIEAVSLSLANACGSVI